MRLKVTPNVGLRYWAAILIASMCGTNLGDIIPDVLKIGAGAGFIMLALMFAFLMSAERATARGSEVFYWIAILLVRAAATNIADYSIAKAHLTYFDVIAALALIFVGILVLQHRSKPKQTKGALPPTDGFYWLTMLIAGSLGTVMGDAIGHSFNSVQVGVPISASIATLALLLIWTARTLMVWLSTTSYWVAVVAVRWWGTNVGDVSAFFLSLIASAVITGLALAILLSASAIISSVTAKLGR
jgi:uncharacterized membrane-anchored protein